jgi:signal-transduction protein with cAMP-binding, CBS, and nucleotidyltransferase domain
MMMPQEQKSLIDLLGSSDFFRDVKEDLLKALLGIGETVQHPPGHRLLEMGRRAEELSIVVSGVVAVGFEVKKGSAWRFIALQDLRRGNGFGWSALVPPYVATLSVQVAEEPCQLFTLPAKELRQQLEKSVELSAVVYRNLAFLVGSRVTILQAFLGKEIQKWLDGH